MFLTNQEWLCLIDGIVVFKNMNYRWPEGSIIPGPEIASDTSAEDLNPTNGEVIHWNHINKRQFAVLLANGRFSRSRVVIVLVPTMSRPLGLQSTVFTNCAHLVLQSPAIWIWVVDWALCWWWLVGSILISSQPASKPKPYPWVWPNGRFDTTELRTGWLSTTEIYEIPMFCPPPKSSI